MTTLACQLVEADSLLAASSRPSKPVMRRKRLLESSHRRASFSEPRSTFFLAEFRPNTLALHAGATPWMGRLDQLNQADFTAPEARRTLREEVARPRVRRRNIGCEREAVALIGGAPHTVCCPRLSAVQAALVMAGSLTA